MCIDYRRLLLDMFHAAVNAAAGGVPTKRRQPVLRQAA